MSTYNIGRGKATQYFEEINKALDDLSQVGRNPTTDSAKPNSLVSGRKPWIISTTELIRQGNGIVWYCNPSEASWKVGLRQATTKNAFSTVTHNWPNSVRGTKFDEIRLSLTFQSGNLIPYNRASQVASQSGTSIDQVRLEEVPPGLVNFYDFLSIMNAPPLLPNGETNHVIIKYHSNIFPSITLIGQFDPDGLSFSDNADNPTNINGWSASFIIYDTNPRLAENGQGTGASTPLLVNYLANMGIRRG